MSTLHQVQRMIWKEYRSIRVIWIAVLFLGLLVQYSMYWSFRNSHGWSFRNHSLLVLSVAIPLCFVIGCILQMFSGEKSDRTFSYLLFLPIRPSVLLIGKILFSVVLAVLMAIPMIFLANYLSNNINYLEYDIHRNFPLAIWSYSMPIRLFAIAILCSLVASSAHKALFMIIAFGIFDTLLPEFLVHNRILGIFSLSFSRLIFISYMVLLFPSLMVYNIVLLRPWLRRITPLEIKRPRLGINLKIFRSRIIAKEYFHNPLQRSVHRFFWKEWRTLRWVAGLVLIAIISFATFHIFHQYALGSPDYHHFTRALDDDNYYYPYRFFLMITMITVTVAPILLLLSPLFIFQGEHQNKNYQFLSDRGISPGLYWIMKQALWFAPLLLTAFIAHIFVKLNMVNMRTPDLRELGILDFSLIYYHVLLIYSAFQFVSFISSRLFVTLLLSVLSATVIFFLSEFIRYSNVPHSLVFLPLSIILLFSTYARTPFWLTEKRGWKSWKLSCITTVVVIPLMYISVIKYRLAEVPVLVRSGSAYLLPPGNFVTPTQSTFLGNVQKHRKEDEDAKKTGKKYQDIIKSITKNQSGRVTLETWKQLDTSSKEWYSENLKLIPQIIETSRSKHCRFVDPWSPYGWHDQIPDFKDVKRLLLVHARKLESENKLKEARDIYLTGFRIDNFVFNFSDTNSLDHYHETNKVRLSKCLNYNILNQWIQHPKQTTELLKETAQLIKEEFEFSNDIPSYAPPSHQTVFGKHRFDLRKVAYLNYYKYFGEINKAKTEKFQDKGVLPFLTFSLIVHGTTEMERTERLLQNNLLINLAVSTSMSYRDINNQPLDYYSSYLTNWESFSGNKEYHKNIQKLENHSLYDTRRKGDMTFPHYIAPFIEVECEQELLLIRMAIKQFELDNGKRPETLEELVNEKYMDKIPSKPYLNAPFNYYPYAIIDPEFERIISNNSDFLSRGYIGYQEYINSHPEMKKKIQKMVDQKQVKMILSFRYQHGYGPIPLYKVKNNEGVEVTIFNR
jgi:ABC-type transport system involved in multi-copper enzyme maturation permease subunit